MKYKISKNIYLFASAFIALIAIYIGFTVLRRTHEGLSDGASTTNNTTIAQTAFYDASTTNILATLSGSPMSYTNLLTSCKNNKMALAISKTLAKDTSGFANITDYDEAIDYLKTLGTSDIVVDNPNINAIIDANNKSTADILFGLSADNQAYIELLTSYKNNKMASQIKEIATNTPTNLPKSTTIGGKVSVVYPTITSTLKISEVDPAIDYLRTLAGMSVITKPEVPTTRSLSLSSA